jgi:hypothetical protein
MSDRCLPIEKDAVAASFCIPVMMVAIEPGQKLK